MKTVIYHSADYDGIFCREIAKYFLGEKDVQYIGWNFGQARIPIPSQGEVYIMDLSPDCLEDGELGHRVIWIDHHKTSIEKWGDTIPGYRIDGVAACRLVWQWFAGNHHGDGECYGLPTKEDFINRNTTRVGVGEPLAVRLAGEYDIWDKRDPRAETFQYSLRAYEPDWSALFGDGVNIDKYLQSGEAAQNYARNVDESICKAMTWIMEWEGLKFLCVNHARFNSLFFAAKDVPETGHDALLGFRFDGKCWMVSMYHAKHRTDLDLSPIAVKHGGGGHRGACGFTCLELPFPLHR